MLCEISVWGNFFTTWLFVTLLGFIGIFGISTVLFMKFYAKPTFESWRYKSNPKYTSPEKVREEIILTAKGMLFATMNPCLSLYLSQHKLSKAYCGVTEEYGWGYLIFSFFVVWLGSDFYEFYYHRLGHTTFWGWK